MNHFALLAAALVFFLHLISETVATFVKYNFSSLGRHMIGISFANIFGIASRGFIALYGIIISIVIEKDLTDINRYIFTFFAVLIISSLFSLFLSNRKLDSAHLETASRSEFPDIQDLARSFSRNNEKCPIPIRGITALILGIQFASVVIAYGLCFYYPNNRLLIVSFVPLISMIGTLTTYLWVEPRLARIIDADNLIGYAAAREFLRARSVSLFFGATLLLGIPILMPALGG